MRLDGVHRRPKQSLTQEDSEHRAHADKDRDLIGEVQLLDTWDLGLLLCSFGIFLWALFIRFLFPFLYLFKLLVLNLFFNLSLICVWSNLGECSQHESIRFLHNNRCNKNHSNRLKTPGLFQKEWLSWNNVWNGANKCTSNNREGQNQRL